jgi:hypothetical protein
MLRGIGISLLIVALAGGWANCAKPAAEPVTPTIQLKEDKSGKGRNNFDVVGLAPAALDRLMKANLDTAQWQSLFAVYVATGKDDKDRPAILGSYQVVDGVVRFEPRFPLVRGVRYRAVFRPARLPGNAGDADMQREFELPKAKPAEAAVLRQVYPSRDKLPENQLKFYLHFSAPMSRGESYRHIQLLDEKGKAVDLPFLELDEELWDPEGKRFTLFFDPGRIKRGLKPREEVGPSLIEGKSYTLVIDRKWEDAQGNPLKETFRKSFRVLAPDDTPPDLKKWRFEAPAAGGKTPLTVRFGKSLDHALLQRLLWVTDASGQRISGSIRVIDEETGWQFNPEQPWKTGSYDLVVDTTLEDLAGNSIGRPFEVDLFRTVQSTVKTTTVKRSFQVK